MVKRVEQEKLVKELDEILGHRPASVPAVLLTTSQTPSSQTEDSAAEGEANGKSS